MTWSVEYMIASGEGEETVGLVPRQATYTVLDEFEAKRFQDTRLCVIRMQTTWKLSYLLTYRAADHVLLLVEEEIGDRRVTLSTNWWGQDSAMFINGHVPDVAIFDAPRFPLEVGLRNIVDHEDLPEGTLEILPLLQEPLPRQQLVRVAVLTTKHGNMDVEGPGTVLNPLGFYQVITADETQHLVTVRMIHPSVPIYDKRRESTLTYDGGVWWKKAEVRYAGKTILTGERVDSE